MNTPSKTITAQVMSGCDRAMTSEIVPMVKPMKPLPMSPRKILAGGQLKYKKPMTAAHNSAGTRDNSVSDLLIKKIVKIKQLVNVSTPVIESIPSIKLKRFSIQTKNRTAIMLPTSPISMVAENNGIGGKPSRIYSAIIAATKWPISRKRAAVTRPRSSR